MVPRSSTVWASGVGVALLGCAGASSAPKTPGTPGIPVVEFPSRTEIESLAQRSAELPKQLPKAYVDRWQITTPVPAPGAAHAVETYWDRLLGETITGSTLNTAKAAAGTRASAELRCAALETARFYVEHEAYPTDAMLGYLSQRCGSTIAAPAIAVVQAVVPDAVPPGRLEVDLEAGVKNLLEQVTSVAKRDVGIGFARGNGRAVVVIVAGERQGTLEGFSPVVQGVGVTLQGEVEGQWAVAFGLVTRGALGVDMCEPDPGVSAPKFRVFCPLPAQQETARIQIVVRRPKRVLYEVAMDALVRRSEQAGLTYEALLFGPDAVAADAEAFRQALFHALGDARKSAGVKPLELEAKQSAWNDRVTPAFYQAWFGNDPKSHEQLTLGMLAGWDVAGTIRDAGMFGRMSLGEARPARWLGTAMEAPLGRWVLLERSMSRVAVSAVAIGELGAGVLLTTYALFEPSDHATARTTLMKNLTAQRAAVGRPAPTYRPPSAELTAALARIESEGISAASALNDLLAELAAAGESVQGMWFEAIDLRQASFLAELIGPPTLDVELDVTHYKPNGAAWGQYAVLVIVRGTPTFVPEESE